MSASRRIMFTAAAWDDYQYWQTQGRKTLKRINQLIREAQRTPFEGIGKPEPLKANLQGFWSRRIDDVNRLVYEATDDQLNIIACRYHYLEARQAASAAMRSAVRPASAHAYPHTPTPHAPDCSTATPPPDSFPPWPPAP